MILSLVFYFTICLFSDVESFRSSYHPGRIVGGEPADIKDFPYQLFLKATPLGISHRCGASIIDRSWALTAGHCVRGYSNEQISLRSGSSYWSRGGTVHYVAKVIIHPKFKPDRSWKRHDYDAAIIKVSSPFPYSAVTQKILMASKSPPTGSRAVVSGWGSWNNKGEYPEQLQKLDVYTIQYKDCSKQYYNYSRLLTPRMLCACSPDGGKYVFNGDSGGPLVADNVQVGIVSFMADKRFPSLLAVYTDVSKIREWATSIIKQESRYF